jgi:hypothetical protein
MRTSVTITCLLLLLFYQTIALSVKSDFDVIKDRVTLNLLQVPIDDGHVLELVNTLQDDGTWPGINYEDVSAKDLSIVIIFQTWLNWPGPIKRSRVNTIKAKK